MSIYRMRTEFGKHLKVILIGIALIFIAGAVWQFGAAPVTRARDEQQDKPIAIVDGMPISKGEFDSVWVQVSENASKNGMRSTLQLAGLRARLFQQLVESRLMLAEAKRMGVAPSKADVDRKIEELVTKQLKENRRAILGTLSKEQEAKDPRDDRDYRSALAQANNSLANQEDMARRMNPPGMVESGMAAEAISKAIEKQVGKVTDKDIKDSYNTYKAQQIVLMEGKLPKEQVKSRAEKIQKEAKSGGDFAKLANENTDQAYKSQVSFEYSTDAPWMVPTQVGDALTKMKPGEVSKVIDTDRGYYIVKLDSITNKMPAKLDKKAKEQRVEMIKQSRQGRIGTELQDRMHKDAKVVVNDPEMRGYWELYEAQQAMFKDQSEYRKGIAKAIKSLETATKQNAANDFATIQLVQLYQMDGKTEKALQRMKFLFGADSSAQGADLNMMYASLLLSTGKAADKEEAIRQYQEASDAAVGDRTGGDRQIHEQLAAKFDELGKPELAKAEREWISNYDKQMAALQEQMKSRAEKSAPKTPAKTEPKPGG